MLRHHLVLTLRNALRDRTYATVSVAGLAVGIAACLLIFLYVRDELTYDAFHPDAERIYRIQRVNSVDDVRLVNDPPLSFAAKLEAEAPGVERAVRYHRASRTVLRQGDQPFYEEDLLYTDAAFFDVFGFRLRRGDPARVLARPGTAVVTPALAERLFGSEDPLGRTFTMGEGTALEVTGVLEPPPSNTRIQFAALVSLETLRAAGTDFDGSLYDVPTYARLAPGASPASVAEAVDAMLANRVQEHPGGKTILQALVDLHLRGQFAGQAEGLGGHIRYVYLFSVVAALLLFIACINTVNLSTARALRRAREVGVRKSVGAHRGQLVVQFLAETVVFVVAALLVAAALVELALPGFNALVDKELETVYFGTGSLLPMLTVLAVMVSLLAGAYPALVLSAFSPARALKGTAAAPSGGMLRQGLVVFQFGASVVLIVAVLVVYNQLRHLQAGTMAIQPAQVVMVPAEEGVDANYAAFRDLLLAEPSVASVTKSTFPRTMGLPVVFEAGGAPQYVSSFIVDDAFLATVGLQVVDGRGFAPGGAGDAVGTVLVNETAAAAFGWEEPVGQVVETYRAGVGMGPVEVVGVVADFPYRSMKTGMTPLLLVRGEASGDAIDGGQVLVRLRAGAVAAGLEALRTRYAAFAPGHPFDYTFLDERFASFYHEERRLGWLLGACAGIAIFIACLGLFGLAVYAAERRTKEIGIRKALGASAASIAALLTSGFLKPVGAAVVLGLPVAYLLMDRWLSDFAERVELGPAVFAAGGVAAVAVALVAVGGQALRAAAADPVRSLRHE